MERDRLDRRWLLAAAAAGIGVIGAGASMAGAGAASDRALHAHATLLDPAGAEIGWAKLTEDGAGRVHVNVKVDGLSPGLHGIHFHAVGACSPDFAAAGGHHNPLGAQHGSHAGDLPNLVVNESGRGRLNATTDAATLSSSDVGLFDGDGTAVIIHANPDDFVTQPTGNSGDRVACGVVMADDRQRPPRRSERPDDPSSPLARRQIGIYAALEWEGGLVGTWDIAECETRAERASWRLRPPRG